MAVWPDVEIKSSPNFLIDAQKLATSGFYLKSDTFVCCPKINKIFGLLLKEYLFQKSTNLVTLAVWMGPLHLRRGMWSRDTCSVTRFGGFSPLWQSFKSLLTIFWMGYLVFGKLLYLLWHFNVTGQIVIVANGQRLKNDSIVNWSHWSPGKAVRRFLHTISSSFY